ncbi:MAG: 23S rRNA (pseudouridine(1915)-N(3))-methyltransferase RlmH [Firmicutes bacterium]|nr:23S rRNA (pseudouridine(1915)-N(3))-methyltransferase RlmH [Bacillota bacterium]MCM1401531.1 23S rRNA (pseudouridine(1915)-N(3))-methyltransferase RlmH [Bacteroides sp.]MCM1476577.1 23S rRNA (pseudouridine(1915)-N(3))-methyltransferase RlmH [Bacteroides sp.]
MKIILLCVGKTRDALLAKAIIRYADRLSHYVGFTLQALPDVKTARSVEQQKEAEGAMMLAALQPADVVVLLDERGRQLTSREFSSDIERRINTGTRRLVYIIGGPYGFSQRVYDRADSLLSLSRMTFSHEMVRLFFTEQLYRAMTIMRGEPYHHD